MAEGGKLVCIVEDDVAVREALLLLLREQGYAVRGFESAESYEGHAVPDCCACLVLDVRLPGISGIALYDLLLARGEDLPVVFLTGHADVPLAVAAMKKGAVDFLTKPVDEQVLYAALERALARHEWRTDRQQARHLLSRLTPREQDVLREVVTGAPNKAIAQRLGIALKTVKIHRGRVMAKLEVHSLVDLVRLADAAMLSPAAEDARA